VEVPLYVLLSHDIVCCSCSVSTLSFTARLDQVMAGLSASVTLKSMDKNTSVMFPLKHL